jgi:integrase
MRDDYAPFFAFARATGMRLRECVTLRWSEVNFGTMQIIKTGKGGRRIIGEITPTIRDIIFPLQGQHPNFVFTYVCACSNRATGRIKGERYPLSYNGIRSAWQRLRARSGVTDFRFHDFRHNSGNRIIPATDGQYRHLRENRGDVGT